MSFIENQGQWDMPALFVARRGGMTTFVEREALVLQLVEPRAALPRSERRRGWFTDATTDVGAEPARRGVAVRLAFENASPNTNIRAGATTPGYTNHFLGTDSSKWRTHVASYASVLYEGLQDGVDLLLHSRGGQLEYDVCLAAGADLDAFVVHCEGVESLQLDDTSNLVMSTTLGPIVQHTPQTWEVDASGDRHEIPCRFRLLGENRYGFEVEGRDDGRRLIIDPGLVWSTYLGGSASDYPVVVETLANGDVLTAGVTESINFPVTPGAFDVTPDNAVMHADQFVTRLTADGAALVFSTYIGGDGGEGIESICIGADESITYGGGTTSINYPTTPGAFQSVYKGVAADALVGRLSAAGDVVLYSTLIGGINNGFEGVVSLAVEPDGSIVASGSTCAQDFPITTDAADPEHGPAACDGFIIKLDPAFLGAAQLAYSSYLFGAGFRFIALEADGAVLGVGATGTSTFPTTPGAFDSSFVPVFSAGSDGVVCRLSADLKLIVASTFLDVDPQDVAFGPGADVTILGKNFTLDMLTPGAYDTTQNGVGDVFVGRLDGSLSTWEWGTLIGGSQTDYPFGIDVDPSGAVIVTGQTSSANYPVTAGAYDMLYSGGTGDAFVSCLSADGSQLLYSSFLGNSGALSIEGLAVTATGIAQVIVVGDGATTTFPVTAGAFDTSFNGGFVGDGFVTSLSLAPSWQKLGGAVAGTNGIPKLNATGSLHAGVPMTLTLLRGKPHGSAVLIIGLGLLKAPFKGGTLVPSPDMVIAGLPLNASGALVLSAPWPAGIPAGLTFAFQEWIPDAVGSFGYAASNGIIGTTP